VVLFKLRIKLKNMTVQSNNFNHNSKIIIPGGAGLVGQNIIVRLKDKGYTNIVVLDKHEANVSILRKLHPDLRVGLVDLAVNGDWVNHFSDASAVIMLQAQIGGLVEHEFTRNNVLSTQILLEVIKVNNITKLVHVSSSVVKSVANDFYTNSKMEQEKIVLESKLPFVILRPTLMFGWFDRKHLGWLSRLMKKIPIFPVPGSGKYMRQPLYVGDFANVIISCLENQIPVGAYDITGLEKVDYIDIIRQVRCSSNSSTKIIHIPYSVFYALLWMWSLIDKNPPFTTQQLQALLGGDEFEVINWQDIFGITATPFTKAIDETFQDERFSKVVLNF
jgi:nucleoside-diphosphate-sugar epimerase